jgi:hypothetical protein
MKNLFTQQNLIYLGIGLVTAYVVHSVLVNREKTTNTTKPVLKADSVDDTSDFCGCGA